jgi:phosphoserine phosphatase RsbU/P
MDDMNSSKFKKCRFNDRRQKKQATVFPLVRNNIIKVKREERQKVERRAFTLSQHLDLFHDLKEKRVKKALENCPVRTYSKRTILIRKGVVNNKLYLVLSGELNVYLGDPDSNDFIVVSSGQCIGEMSIIDKNPASAHVIASPGCRLLEIDDNHFWDHIITLPKVARNLLKVQTERARATNKAILQQRERELQFKQIEKDLTIANQIQMSMLPRNSSPIPGCSELEIYARMVPAREIGGDLYDFFQVGPDRFFFILGDVSGKGIPAALFMVRTMTLFRTLVGTGEDPAAILQQVNTLLQENNNRFQFVTLICGMMDLSTREIHYSNGGHNPPLLINANGDSRFLKLPEGNVVGVIRDSEFKNDSFQLREGEKLLLYTDGVTEATNENLQMFSDERLHRLLSDKKATSAKLIVEKVLQEVVDFAGNAPQADDITILALGLSASHN